jgi:beta-fructofuranosidase
MIFKRNQSLLARLLLAAIAVHCSFCCLAQGDTIRMEKPAQIWITDSPVPGPVLQFTRSLREKFLADPYRPAFHFCLPEDIGVPGDPNGAFYYKGKYHLMYLYNREGHGFSWGHVSSSDFLHWRHHPDALIPGGQDEGIFSGGAFVNDDGTAYLSYWMLWGAKGIGVATSKGDDFNQWTKFSGNPVIKSTGWGFTDTVNKQGERMIYGSADPSNIWKKDGHYYMLTGNLLVLGEFGRDENSDPHMQGDWLDLFTSDDLKTWKYLHRFYQSDRKWTDKSEDDMCPSFLPLPGSPDGGLATDKHLLLFISHNKGCQYYIGDYKGENFFPTTHGRMTWNDNAFFAPEALIDGKGRQIMWSWIFDDRSDSAKKAIGWTGTYSLPRSLWLAKDGSLGITPVEELKQLRINPKSKSSVIVKNNSPLVLDDIATGLMELELTILPGNATQTGVTLCASANGREKTVIYYDAADKQLKIDTRNSSIGIGRKTIESAPFELKKGEPLILRIFVDKSVVEVFANERQAIARSIYPTLNGQGLSVFANGGDVRLKSVKAWELMPSNPY